MSFLYNLNINVFLLIPPKAVLQHQGWTGNSTGSYVMTCGMVLSKSGVILLLQMLW